MWQDQDEVREYKQTEWTWVNKEKSGLQEQYGSSKRVRPVEQEGKGKRISKLPRHKQGKLKRALENIKGPQGNTAGPGEEKD